MIGPSDPAAFGTSLDVQRLSADLDERHLAHRIAEQEVAMNRPRIALEDPDRVLHGVRLAEQQSPELVERKAVCAFAVRLMRRIGPHSRPSVREAFSVEPPGMHLVEAGRCAIVRRDYLGRDEPLPIRRLDDDKSSPRRERIITIAGDQRPPVNRGSPRRPGYRAVVIRPVPFHHARTSSIAPHCSMTVRE